METTKEKVESIINRLVIRHGYSSDEAIEDLMELIQDRDLLLAERNKLLKEKNEGDIARQRDKAFAEIVQLRGEKENLQKKWDACKHLKLDAYYSVESERDAFREQYNTAMADKHELISALERVSQHHQGGHSEIGVFIRETIAKYRG